MAIFSALSVAGINLVGLGGFGVRNLDAKGYFVELEVRTLEVT